MLIFKVELFNLLAYIVIDLENSLLKLNENFFEEWRIYVRKMNLELGMISLYISIVIVGIDKKNQELKAKYVQKMRFKQQAIKITLAAMNMKSAVKKKSEQFSINPN